MFVLSLIGCNPISSECTRIALSIVCASTLGMPAVRPHGRCSQRRRSWPSHRTRGAFLAWARSPRVSTSSELGPGSTSVPSALGTSSPSGAGATPLERLPGRFGQLNRDAAAQPRSWTIERHSEDESVTDFPPRRRPRLHCLPPLTIKRSLSDHDRRIGHSHRRSTGGSKVTDDSLDRRFSCRTMRVGVADSEHLIS
jgi:hypothetical protein